MALWIFTRLPIFEMVGMVEAAEEDSKKINNSSTFIRNDLIITKIRK